VNAYRNSLGNLERRGELIASAYYALEDPNITKGRKEFLEWTLRSLGEGDEQDSHSVIGER